MNVNEKILGLKEIADCPVVPDVYDGTEDRYITFTYEDERPDTRADNGVEADVSYIQIAYFVPKTYDYMNDKHRIRDYLEANGFQVTSIRSWIDADIIKEQYIRHVAFETSYLESRRK